MAATGRFVFLGSLFARIVSFSSRVLFIPTLAACYFVSSLVWCELKCHSTVLFLCTALYLVRNVQAVSGAFFSPLCGRCCSRETESSKITPNVLNITSTWRCHTQEKNDSSVVFPAGCKRRRARRGNPISYTSLEGGLRLCAVGLSSRRHVLRAGLAAFRQCRGARRSLLAVAVTLPLWADSAGSLCRLKSKTQTHGEKGKNEKRQPVL